MASMIPIIMDPNFNKLGMIDDYKSFIWTTRYYSPGDFELCTGLTEKSIEFLKANNYIMREDDEHIGIIETLEIDITEENEQIIIASGRFLSSILARRIIAAQTQVSGSVSKCIETLINDAIINPTITARKIDNFTFGEYESSETMSAQYTGDNLQTTITDICEQFGIGFKTTLTDDNNFLFQLFEGTDRSYDQSENPYMVFSDKYDNLLTSQYTEDRQKIVTDVLAAGEGEGTERKTIWVTTGSPSGLERYEYFDDARNISSNNGEITDEEYYTQLSEDGEEDLTTYTTAFSGEVDFSNVNYKVDLNIGDICSIENTKLNMYINARLVEVIESIDESGKYQIIPTFGV